ncbi:MAG: ATP-grasp domain-containing protein [Planctomycetota bacterium]
MQSPIRNRSDRPAAFVTYGWCRTAYAVVRSLARRGVRVHVGDESRLAMCRGSIHAASFSVLPDFLVRPEEYVEAVVAAMRRHNAGVLLPCHEDVGVFAARRERLPADIAVAIPSREQYALVEDKYDVIREAQACGLDVPRTITVGDVNEMEAAAAELSWPVVVKTRTGNSAKGVRVVRDIGELRAAFDGFVRDYALPPHRWPFLQEHLPGRGIGVCVICDRGRCNAVFGEQYLRCKDGHNLGTSTFRSAYRDDGLFERVGRLFERLGWHGVAHCDFVLDAEGAARMIEVNPRPWGALWLAVQAGVDFPYLWYLLAQGATLPAPGDFDQRATCRWLLGEAQAVLAMARSGRLRDLLAVFRPRRRCEHDDLDRGDPAPLLLQAVDYGLKMLRGGVNPVQEGMIR